MSESFIRIEHGEGLPAEALNVGNRAVFMAQPFEVVIWVDETTCFFKGEIMAKGILLMMVGWAFCVGCSPTFPKMPHVNTPQARDCLRTCQRQHNGCADACTDADNLFFRAVVYCPVGGIE